MKTYSVTILSAVALINAGLADVLDIRGIWTSVDGTAAARIEACADDTSRLCATIISEAVAAGAASRVGQVALRNLEQAGDGRWRGHYHSEQQVLPVTLHLRGLDTIDMRTCVFVFCTTEHYRRAPR